MTPQSLKRTCSVPTPPGPHSVVMPPPALPPPLAAPQVVRPAWEPPKAVRLSSPVPGLPFPFRAVWTDIFAAAGWRTSSPPRPDHHLPLSAQPSSSAAALSEPPQKKPKIVRAAAAEAAEAVPASAVPTVKAKARLPMCLLASLTACLPVFDCLPACVCLPVCLCLLNCLQPANMLAC